MAMHGMACDDIGGEHDLEVLDARRGARWEVLEGHPRLLTLVGVHEVDNLRAWEGAGMS